MASKIKVFVKQKTTQDTSPRMQRHRAALARSKSIDHQLDDERERRKHEVQLLILGGASSGKSTFIKQLRIHHGDGFPQEVREGLRPQVCENLTDALTVLLDQMDTWGVEFSDTQNKEFATELRTTFPHINYYYIPSSPTSPLQKTGACALIPVDSAHLLMTRDTARQSSVDYSKVTDYNQQILSLWRDAGIQYCYERRHQFSTKKLYPAEEYVLENVERICGEGYIPSLRDVLCIRKPTLGVHEHHFSANGLNYRVIDVAGQKNQRKKWIHFFEGVTAVSFFVALSGYCENLEEDPTINSLDDSLHTYREVVTNQFLEKTDFILFLNKKDIFAERMRHFSLTEHFTDFKGKTPEEGIAYIRAKFQSSAVVKKQTYIHVSCAIDVDLMKKLIANVMDIIVESNLKKSKQML